MGTKRRMAAVAAAGIIGLGGLALQVGTSGAGGVVARAELRNQAGQRVGEVVFKKKGGEIVGIAEVQVPVEGTEFRGFHLHANNVDSHPVDGNPADGCVGDFSSVDGHWLTGNQKHGAHAGDLPVLMRDATGHAEARFVIGKFQPGDIVGRAVVVHFGADNYANIPTRYQSNASATSGADDTTLLNGDASGRYACGVIVSRGGGDDDDDD